MPPQDRFDTRRPDPEALLRQVQAEAQAAHRGQLKIFLGYASGVGKSFKLFDEGRRRHARGEDVVIGALQPEVPEDVVEVIGGIEVIPTSIIDGVPVMDVPAVLRRHPAVCLVDGLAYDHPAGCRHRKRYEDVQEILEHGISVLTSINLEYIAEQQEFVRSVVEAVPTDSVPQSFVVSADEVVVVDAPPETVLSERDHDGLTLRARLAQQLSQLRERALLLTADVVDRQLEAYLELHGIESSWGTQERILVCMTPRADATAMLASGRRNADRFHGELFAIYVNQPNLTPQDRIANERNIKVARAERAQVDVLDGKDPVATILEYARDHGVTQLFVGHNLRRDWRARLRGSPLDRLIEGAEGMDVRVFPHRT
ncbi:MAG TPA: universal stress protein [Vicinamibacterales bacterium]|jgi:two-component system sensor histidine kinase KdpD